MITLTHFEFMACDRAGKGATIRERVAWGLRWAADKIDGYQSLAWRCDSKPAVDHEYQAQCISCGLDQASDLMCEKVESESWENLTQALRPDLYGEWKQ